MDKFTFGKSQSAINLIESILPKPENQVYRRKVCRMLSKQIEALNGVCEITDTGVRKTTLEMWHKRFLDRMPALPRVVETHIKAVEAGMYRDRLQEAHDAALSSSK